MPRWLWWMPLAVLTLVAALLVFRQGVVAVRMTETDVITHYASRYVATGPQGAKATDCAARPGDVVGVWLIVSCGGAAHVVHYLVDRAGRLVPGTTGRVPET